MPALDKIMEWLKTLDEESICELLNIHTEDILERFKDLVIDRRAILETEYEDFEEGYEESFDEEDSEYSEGYRRFDPFEDREDED